MTEFDSAQPAVPRRPNRLHRWVIAHDDSWLFIASYIGAAVILSVWLGLFWLVVVVGVHFAFEWVRQRHLDPRWPGVALRVAWELKLDVALVLFGLVLAVYLETILGLAGLGGAARLGAEAAGRGMQVGARAAGWVRGIRAVLLSLDDAAQVAKAVAMRRQDRDGDTGLPDAAPALAPWRRRTMTDRISIGLGAGCLLLLVIAPLILPDQTFASVGRTLATELHPFNAGP